MNVKELIKRLQDEEPEAEVMFTHPSHDHWRTELASPVDDVYQGRVKYSGYHEQDKVAEDDDAGALLVVLLS